MIFCTDERFFHTAVQDPGQEFLLSCNHNHSISKLVLPLWKVCCQMKNVFSLNILKTARRYLREKDMEDFTQQVFLSELCSRRFTDSS